MQPGPYEQVPLTEDDRNLLMAVYKVRRRILLMACFFVMFMAFLGSQHGIDNYDRYTGKLVSRWEETYDSRFLNRMGYLDGKYRFSRNTSWFVLPVNLVQKSTTHHQGPQSWSEGYYSLPDNTERIFPAYGPVLCSAR